MHLIETESKRLIMYLTETVVASFSLTWQVICDDYIFFRTLEDNIYILYFLEYKFLSSMSYFHLNKFNVYFITICKCMENCVKRVFRIEAGVPFK